MARTVTTKTTQTLGALTLAALVSGAALAPSVALAVPAGGYGDLVARVSPSVVLIEVTQTARTATAEKTAPDPFQDFMRRFGAPIPGQPQGGVKQAVGAGFIISATGEVVTDNHVVEGADTVKVKLSDGRSYDAEGVGADPLTDVAPLRIKTIDPLPALNWRDRTQMRPRDAVVAVGNPFGRAAVQQ